MPAIFQQADCGTLFLDEIGELTWEGQAKLLRILEGHPFLPVGATQQVTVDVRVIAATNQDLQTYVQQRKFREDLYYRLSVFELNVPPLRDRGSDIELLLNFFFDHFRRQHGRPGLTLSDDARQKLLSYPWPGNVRQLRNVIDSAVVLASGSQIEPDDLGLRSTGGGELESLRLDFWERKLVTEAPAPHGWKRAGSGQAAGDRPRDAVPQDRGIWDRAVGGRAGVVNAAVTKTQGRLATDCSVAIRRGSHPWA